MGYIQWRNFQSIIEKAKDSADNAGEKIYDHFANVSKMVPLFTDEFWLAHLQSQE